MAYDDTAKKLAVKAIGEVESGMDYGSLNYSDPITVGMGQWYGVRAAAILNRMRATPSWSGVAPSLNNQLATIGQTDTFWNSRYLTTTEGDTIRPILEANKVIQNDQIVRDVAVYKTVAESHGMDPETNTDAVLFFFVMYHQRPVSALDIIATEGPDSTMAELYSAALADPIFGDYASRYTTARDIIAAGDVTGIDIGDGLTIPDNDPISGGDPGANHTGNLRYIKHVGDTLQIHYNDGQVLTALPDGRGHYLPKQGPAVAPSPVNPGDPATPPGEPTGEWRHPLPGSRVTSGYGPRPAPPGTMGASFHYGIDFATVGAAGTVVAPHDMIVTVATDTGNWSAGTHVKGHTPDGAHTSALYHMQYGSLKVAASPTVIPAGTPLGIEGATGNVTGRHLHWEIFTGNFANPWAPGQPTIDPGPVLTANGVSF